MALIMAIVSTFLNLLLKGATAAFYVRHAGSRPRALPRLPDPLTVEQALSAAPLPFDAQAFARRHRARR